MGRGRQRAKQAKVARDLKYQHTGTDFAALQRELSTGGDSRTPEPSEAMSGDAFDDHADLDWR
jgi:hypothetical protein